MTEKEILKWINRLRVKSTHKKMVDGEMLYWDYRHYIREISNQIRSIYNLYKLSDLQFDLAWQNLSLANENWKVAKSDIVALISS